MPVGMCVTRTALSVVLTCCPPAPLARNASNRSSLPPPPTPSQRTKNERATAAAATAAVIRKLAVKTNSNTGSRTARVQHTERTPRGAHKHDRRETRSAKKHFVRRFHSGCRHNFAAGSGHSSLSLSLSICVSSRVLSCLPFSLPLILPSSCCNSVPTPSLCLPDPLTPPSFLSACPPVPLSSSFGLSWCRFSHLCSSFRSTSSASIITTTEAALVCRRCELEGTRCTC